MMTNTNELEGRALRDAAARAMGWTCSAEGFWRDGDGAWKDRETDGPEPTELEMLAWLHERGDCVILGCYREFVTACATSVVAEDVHAGGTDLSEALARLVVAVKEREAKQA